MSYKLPIADSVESTFYRALTAKIKNNPTLKRVVKAFQLFDGSEDTYLDPTVNTVPFLVVRPSQGSGSVQTESMTDTSLIFDIIIYTDGLDACNALNLWDALRKCIYSGDGTTQKMMTDNRAYSIEMTRPAYTTSALGDGNVLVAEGQITVKFKIASGF